MCMYNFKLWLESFKFANFNRKIFSQQSTAYSDGFAGRR